jgi:hypothetical protein
MKGCWSANTSAASAIITNTIECILNTFGNLRRSNAEKQSSLFVNDVSGFTDMGLIAR